VATEWVYNAYPLLDVRVSFALMDSSHLACWAPAVQGNKPKEPVTVDHIRGAGFDIIPNPTKKLPNHYRLIHPDGVAGFNDENLAQLSAVFTETSGHKL
jgi:hypothetical protein